MPKAKRPPPSQWRNVEEGDRVEVYVEPGVNWRHPIIPLEEQSSNVHPGCSAPFYMAGWYAGIVSSVRTRGQMSALYDDEKVSAMEFSVTFTKKVQKPFQTRYGFGHSNLFSSKEKGLAIAKEEGCLSVYKSGRCTEQELRQVKDAMARELELWLAGFRFPLIGDRRDRVSREFFDLHLQYDTCNHKKL